MILIADSGGTKVEWCLLNGDKVMARYNVPGMNAMMLTSEEMGRRIADEVVPEVSAWVVDVTEVYFYGAGCVSEAVCSLVAGAITANFPAAKAYVHSDLLGAARGLCGNKPGIACILGTGSNSCYYDGVAIVDNVSPLGFILGDEGSGAYLGKTLLGDVLKRQLPEHVCRMFFEEYDYDAVSIIRHVYREPYPNRFLASFTPFLSRHLDEPSLRALVVDAFKAFFRRNVCSYSAHKDVPVCCCGSIGYYFKDLFTEAAAAYGFVVGDVLQAPMDGLIRYHSSN